MAKRKSDFEYCNWIPILKVFSPRIHEFYLMQMDNLKSNSTKIKFVNSWLTFDLLYEKKK
jgi:hypothetical protein